MFKTYDEETDQLYHQEFPYLNNCKSDMRFLGANCIATEAEYTSSSRTDMYTSHTVQRVEILGGEHPECFTGKDIEVNEYMFNTPYLSEEDVTILGKVPKYHSISGEAFSNPSMTILFINKNKVVDFKIIKKFNMFSDAFGQTAQYTNMNLVKEGNIIKAKTPLVKYPNDGYCGVNCLVALMPDDRTTEDSFAFYEGFLEKCAFTAVSEAHIKIKQTQIPNNLFGDEFEYKFMHDIGETIGIDGLLCSIRTPKKESFLSDFSNNNEHDNHDIGYYGEPGATIVDIDIYADHKFRKNRFEHFSQLQKYYDQFFLYCEKINKIYETSIKNHDLSISPKLHNLIVKCKQFLNRNIKKGGMLKYQQAPIDYIYLKITYAWTVKPNKAFKFTGRSGDKGTMSNIYTKEEAPRDEYGRIIDCIINPLGVPNRMNAGQLYSMFLSNASDTVLRNIKEGKNDKPPYEYIMEYISIINENYAKLIDEEYNDKKEEFVNMCYEEYLYLHLPPFLKTLNRDAIKFIAKKYDVKDTKLTFKRKNRDGVLVEKTTKKPIPVGRKYMHLLCKVPKTTACGISRVSQFSTPFKMTSIPREFKKCHPIKITPIKFGEDEVRNLILSCGSITVARMLGVYGSSPLATKCLISSILSAEEPSNLNNIEMSTEDIIKNNIYSRIQKSVMALHGVKV